MSNENKKRDSFCVPFEILEPAVIAELHKAHPGALLISAEWRPPCGSSLSAGSVIVRWIPSPRKIPCVKVTRPDSHGEKFFCLYRLAAFSAVDEFDGAENGERIALELCEMTEEEISALPEFEGW